MFFFILIYYSTRRQHASLAGFVNPRTVAPAIGGCFSTEIFVSLTMMTFDQTSNGRLVDSVIALLSSWKMLLHPSFDPPPAGTHTSSSAKQSREEQETILPSNQET